MAKKSETSRVPSAVGSIPVVGGLMKNADAQARWMQELVEQNARLVGQLPATMKTFNDSLERFNQTISRLDQAVTQLERTSRGITGPIRDTQKQVAQLQTTIERIVAVLAELPGAGILRRLGPSRPPA